MGNKRKRNEGNGAPSPVSTNASFDKQDHLQNVIITVVTVAVIAIVVILAVVLGHLERTAEKKPSPSVTYEEYATDAPSPNADMAAIRQEIDSMSVEDFNETVRKTDYVKITIKGYGDVIVRLRKDIAPITVANFQSLVEKGFYNGLTIHRVVKGFAIQGGDPKGDGSGGSESSITGEFTTNGVRNDLSHIAGVISMARKPDQYNSATSQFMICNANATEQLDGTHAAFGYVVAGYETVLLVSDVEVTAGSGEVSRPKVPVIIEKICFVAKKPGSTTADTIQETNG